MYPSVDTSGYWRRRTDVITVPYYSYIGLVPPQGKQCQYRSRVTATTTPRRARPVGRRGFLRRTTNRRRIITPCVIPYSARPRPTARIAHTPSPRPKISVDLSCPSNAHLQSIVFCARYCAVGLPCRNYGGRTGRPLRSPESPLLLAAARAITASSAGQTTQRRQPKPSKVPASSSTAPSPPTLGLFQLRACPSASRTSSCRTATGR